MTRKYNDMDDDDVLRDGESLRVPMTMMDALQKDVGEYGAIGKPFAHQDIPGDLEHTVPHVAHGAPGPVGGDPESEGVTREILTKKGPARSTTQAEAEEARMKWLNQVGMAWKGQK